MSGGLSRLAAGLACALLCGSCGPDPGLRHLSFHTNPLTGQVNLPMERWVLNEGVVVDEARFCPAPACQTPSAVFLLTASGEVAARLRRELASDQALTKRRPPVRTRLLGGGVRVERGKLSARTAIARSQHEGRDLTQVVLSPARGQGPVAHLAILTREDAGLTRFAVSVSNDAAVALAGAESLLKWR